MCPDALERRIRGVLATTIFHGIEKVLTDVARNFILQPGQWIVDADLVIPAAAKSGGYVWKSFLVAEAYHMATSRD
jgi:hypothetical protein